MEYLTLRTFFELNKKSKLWKKTEVPIICHYTTTQSGGCSFSMLIDSRYWQVPNRPICRGHVNRWLWVFDRTWFNNWFGSFWQLSLLNHLLIKDFGVQYFSTSSKIKKGFYNICIHQHDLEDLLKYTLPSSWFSTMSGVGLETAFLTSPSPLGWY